MEFKHQSVLLYECIDGLNIKPDGTYVDGTIGGGGHSLEILKKLGEKGRLIGIDRDSAALEASGKRLAEYSGKLITVHDNYTNIKAVLKRNDIEKINGMLLDLGVSSYQLDTPERGFSYMLDAPLDMRMDKEDTLSAYSVVNEYKEDELAKIIFNYGEERFARRIAKKICEAREKKPLQTTFELVDIIKRSMPKEALRSNIHPAKRTFQAIRIEVNGELCGLESSINDMIEVLESGGRLVIITFHSLEDRIVKTLFKTAENPCTCPPDFPVCICGKKPLGKVITRKPVLPSEEELQENHRSRSAKMRIFEKY